MGSLQSIVIYKYFCALRMRVRPVSAMPHHQIRGPPVCRSPLPRPLSILGLPVQRWPSMWPSPVLKTLHPICPSITSARVKALLCNRSPPTKKYEDLFLATSRGGGLLRFPSKGGLCYGDLRGLRPASPTQL
jgi:hypothetical protein